MKLISRRKMLRNTSWLGTTLAVGLRLGTTTSSAASGEQPAGTRKLKVVVAGGHPGDPEYGCGGTIVRLTSFGDEVVLVYSHRGDPAAKSPAVANAVRPREARQ